MRERLIALRERRAMLLARAEGERRALEAWLVRTDRVARWVDSGASLVDKLKRNPLWIAGAVALLFVLRPRRVLRWAATGWSLWRVARRARIWLQQLQPLAPRPGRTTSTLSTTQ